MVRVLALTGLLCTPGLVAAHHSHAEFSSGTEEIRGVLESVVWRNPHPAMTLRATGAPGRGTIWRIQVQGNVNGLSRDGVSGAEFVAGTELRIAGHLSTRRREVLLATRAEFDDGTVIVLGPDESTGSAVYRGEGVAPEAARDAPSRGIYRVWTVGSRVRNENLPLTAPARAAKEAWDPLLDDPQRGCRPLGMPGAMMSPHPIEFREARENVEIRLEEWGSVRTIRMTDDARRADVQPSPLGHSIGHWEGDTLVVTTTGIDYPYMDEHGTPQSEAVEVRERFTLSEDERSLEWAATVIDPETLTEPVVAFTTRWDWIPGEEIQPYDCAELDPL